MWFTSDYIGGALQILLLLLQYWLGCLVVERRSLTGELSLVCTGPAADG